MSKVTREHVVSFTLISAGVAVVFGVSLWLRPAANVVPVGLAKSGGYALTFREEFKGATLDAEVWNTCYEWYDKQFDGCTNYGNDESEWYKSSQVRVSGGALTLSAQRETVRGSDRDGWARDYAFVSGMVSTGRATKSAPPKWQGTYGYYEAKMMVPSGKAIWPAFWLLPTDHSWPPEIDVMELLGDKPNEILNTYFWKNAQGNTAKDSSTHVARESYAGAWHVYGVDWRKSRLDWYIDGQKVKTAKGATIPSKPMQIILNLAVGGNLPGSPDTTTPSSTQVKVDYVRVFGNEDTPKD